MNLSVDQKLAINMKVARDMGIYSKPLQFIPHDGLEAIVTSSAGKTFNIFDLEKGDLNKAVEFYGIDVVKDGSYWAARRFIYEHGVMKPEFDKASEDRTTAIIKAVTAASGVTI